MIIIKISILYFIQIRHTDKFLHPFCCISARPATDGGGQVRAVTAATGSGCR